MDLLNLKGQRILITGGLGFIGSNLAHKCLALGAEVTIYDSLDPKSGGNMQNIAGIEKDIQLVLNDIRNFEGVCASILNKDIIFNCAAYTSHPGAMREPLLDIDVNCKGVINILEAGRRFNPSIKIVHIGTSTQIGKMQLDVIDELHPEFPMDIYSANKSVSEKYVLIYGSGYKMATTVVRLANTFGPRSNIKSPDFGFINYFVGLALQNKEITIFGEGKQLRNFSYVEDSVNALILASQNVKTNGQVFFAVSDKQHTVADVATKLVEIIGGSVRFIEWPKDREAIEVGDAVVSNKKIKSILEWNPQFGLVEGLSKTRDYFRAFKSSYL
ncbi:MAG: GDP-mannose 4,6-dehydratase [Cytophagales bacterium]|nr:GDP-mannose 4,6-dehydratase [Cytophagales bacterium]